MGQNTLFIAKCGASIQIGMILPVEVDIVEVLEDLEVLFKIKAYNRMVFPSSYQSLVEDYGKSISTYFHRLYKLYNWKCSEPLLFNHDVAFYPDGNSYAKMYADFGKFADVRGSRVVNTVYGQGLGWKDIKLLMQLGSDTVTKLAIGPVSQVARMMDADLLFYDKLYDYYASFLKLAWISCLAIAFHLAVTSYQSREHIRSYILLYVIALYGLLMICNPVGLIWPHGLLDYLGNEDFVVSCRKSKVKIVMSFNETIKSMHEQVFNMRLGRLTAYAERVERNILGKLDWYGYTAGVYVYAQGVVNLIWANWILESITPTLFVMQENFMPYNASDSVPNVLQDYGCQVQYTNRFELLDCGSLKNCFNA